MFIHSLTQTISTSCLVNEALIMLGTEMLWQTKQMFILSLAGVGAGEKVNHYRRDSQLGNVLSEWVTTKWPGRSFLGSWDDFELDRKVINSYTKGEGSLWGWEAAQETSIWKLCGDEGPDLCRISERDQIGICIFVLFCLKWNSRTCNHLEVQNAVTLVLSQCCPTTLTDETLLPRIIMRVEQEAALTAGWVFAYFTGLLRTINELCWLAICHFNRTRAILKVRASTENIPPLP